jgi:hypothetical protein
MHSFTYAGLREISQGWLVLHGDSGFESDKTKKILEVYGSICAMTTRFINQQRLAHSLYIGNNQQDKGKAMYS